MIEQGLFENRQIDFSHTETFIFRDKALVRPVVYDTSAGKRSFSFQLARQADGMWLTIPWTCSGWHGMVDSLETLLTGRKISNDFGLGGEFYWTYMRNYHRYAPLTDDLPPGNLTAEEWREVYLTKPG